MLPRLLLPLICLTVCVAGERPKVKDPFGQLLVNINDIPVGSCGGDSYFGLGMMNGSLEKCDMWQKTGQEVMAEYEQYKCSHLRMHAAVSPSTGKCECLPKWKGPICNDFVGCPDGMSFHNNVCTQNICQNDGELAVGGKEIECICKVPWDGRTCERLACFRKTKLGQDKRFANDGKKCKCGRHYSGENCDVITSCYNDVELVDGKCMCPDGWGGEICDKKCPKNELTCSTVSLSASLALICSLFLARL